MAHFFVRFDQVESQALGWVWFPYLARGKATLLEGDPGVGKSTVALDLVARLSRGAEMPGEKTAGKRAMRSFLVAPDHDARTLHERLVLAGADLSCVMMSTDSRLLCDDQNLRDLDDVLYMQDIDLLVIDAAPALLGKVKWRDEAEVRAAIRPLIELAERRKVALLILMPTLEGRNRRAIGTCGIFSVALEVVEHPRMFGSVVLFHRRSNIGPRRDPVYGRLFEAGDDELVKWTDLLDAEISRPLGKMTGPPANVITPEMIAAAVLWLEGFLKGKIIAERLVFAASDRLGFRRSVVVEAKMRLRYSGEAEVIDGRREWVWVGFNEASKK